MAIKTTRRPTTPGENPIPGLIWLHCFGGPREGEMHKECPEGYYEGIEEVEMMATGERFVTFLWLSDEPDAIKEMRRRIALADLTRMSEEMGGYDVSAEDIRALEEGKG